MQLTQAFTKFFPQLSIACDLVLEPRRFASNLKRALRVKSRAKEDIVKGIVGSGDGRSMKKILYMRPHHVVIPMILTQPIWID